MTLIASVLPAISLASIDTCPRTLIALPEPKPVSAKASGSPAATGAMATWPRILNALPDSPCVITCTTSPLDAIYTPTVPFEPRARE